eukprot:TRINITY_DN33595_c0_g1_i1.p1 TRINITY_DN33595_c0_g1~~TRINITY_DN33595_c0_g1_i1.p1  ORF type:complete len:422 (-),score=77.59 TRINITY_DN33595_c0_g1_i1:16-1281(-)
MAATDELAPLSPVVQSSAPEQNLDATQGVRESESHRQEQYPEQPELYSAPNSEECLLPPSQQSLAASRTASRELHDCPLHAKCVIPIAVLVSALVCLAGYFALRPQTEARTAGLRGVSSLDSSVHSALSNMGRYKDLSLNAMQKLSDELGISTLKNLTAEEFDKLTDAIEALEQQPANTTTTTTQDFLFCWALIAAGGSEEALLKDHYARGTNIFACDAWLVVSDFHVAVTEHADSVTIGAMNSQRSPWNSWYNVPVFLRAWDQVIKDGRFNKFNWTVKADADTFFCAKRLRQRLRHTYVPQWEGVFWLNYDAAHNPGPLDFLGPLEVFSRKAMQLYEWKQKWACPNPAVQTQGEDGFMRSCMYKIGAKSRTDFNLLKNACDWCKPLDPKECASSQFVAFHPFKDQKSFQDCSEAAAAHEC